MNQTEIIGNLWMGGQWKPTLADGFGAVVNLRMVEDAAFPASKATMHQNGPVCLWMPLIDRPLAPPKWKVMAAAAFVFNTLMAGIKTLVHCEEGHNRSGLVVGAYLVMCVGMNPANAIALIRQKRPGSLTNQVFCNMLNDLSKV